MLADLKGPVLADYGIEIKTLGIKQLKVSEDVTKKVFERMKAERQGRTEAIISEGAAIAMQIQADANKKRDTLLDAAEGRAKEIRGQGDADAATVLRDARRRTRNWRCSCGTSKPSKRLSRIAPRS